MEPESGRELARRALVSISAEIEGSLKALEPLMAEATLLDLYRQRLPTIRAAAGR